MFLGVAKFTYPSVYIECQKYLFKYDNQKHLWQIETMFSNNVTNLFREKLPDPFIFRETYIEVIRVVKAIMQRVCKTKRCS